MELFAKRFKELRLKHNYSMQAIGELLDCGKSTIAAWESAEKIPRTPKFKMICDIFGVSSDFLLGLTDDPVNTKQTRNIAILLKESKDLHYNGIPLTNQDLELFNTILERMLKPTSY